ncbi:trehalase-like isoform X1 [Galleria mellonella]|uniref:Trehalase n=2 Tax=Galleria mellonella TaxID=7137 RepID=A0ABM3MNW7_GALME|nr:trehalase-like isoform X1 [Galleria mellonella]XP_052753074.1 trehalase-like isoform X1 [Galleria mellonella]XP_052753075.1 trehalase-like isoform X1 [Galleria mellonella]
MMMMKSFKCCVMKTWCLLVLVSVVGGDRSNLPPTCDSLIYCHGPLLDTVQMAGLYNDSKTFVDMKIKFSPNITMEHFRQMMNRTGSHPTKADILEFVNDNFDPEGSEFEDWRPTDWKDSPAFLDRIKDPLLHKWASELNRLWLQLGRKMKDEVKENQELYSIIYVDNPVIVPGGRFREFYYWDSYWIIKGLLLSEMRATARGMVSNFLDIVDRIGFIPNGGRIYYAMRSQPPLLIPMMQLIMEDFEDVEFLRRHIHTLDKEFDFWITNHTVEVEHNGHTYKLSRFIDQSQGPRPESYKEDIDCAKHFDTFDKKEEFYAELKAAAESGWDFSSRWFILNGTNKGNLTNLKTRSIVPVDLNSIMCWNAKLLQEFHSRVGNVAKAEYYREIHAKYMEAIDKVFWHEEVGAWLDFNLESGRPRDYFYPSNLAPLWTGSYDKTRKEYYVNRVINYLDKVKVDIYEGGIPATFEHSGEQWDYPNAWPPLQYMVVMGLANTGLPDAMRYANEIATKWVRSNFEVWKEKTAMLEKYDATIFGGFGGGGEYVVQTGFGWTNGVVMSMLNRYGETLSAADEFGTSPADNGAIYGAHVGASGVATAILVIAASLATGALGLVMYRKRKENIVATGGEDLKLLSRKPYTELQSLNGASIQRQR